MWPRSILSKSLPIGLVATTRSLHTWPWCWTLWDMVGLEVMLSKMMRMAGKLPITRRVSELTRTTASQQAWLQPRPHRDTSPLWKSFFAEFCEGNPGLCFIWTLIANRPVCKLNAAVAIVFGLWLMIDVARFLELEIVSTSQLNVLDVGKKLLWEHGSQLTNALINSFWAKTCRRCFMCQKTFTGLNGLKSL